MENKTKKTIRELRMMTGLHQAEFGKRLGGIPLRTIQNWESGERTPPEWVVELIAFRVENDKELAAQKVLGYDQIDGKLVTNTDEAEIVKFIFNKVNEYTEHPPKELVDRVLEIAEENGEVLTYEEAEQRVSYSAILNYIAKEMNANEELVKILKRNDSHTLKGSLRYSDECAIKSESIITKEMWELAQKKMKDKRSVAAIDEETDDE